MKAKIFIMAALALLIVNAKAQKNIEAMIKKCETYSSVDMDVIKSKSRDGKRQENKSVHIRINSDRKLIDDFVKAFRDDESDADDVVFKKVKGKEVAIELRFSQMHYSIRLRDDKDATFIARYNPQGMLGSSFRSVDGLNNGLMYYNRDSLKFYFEGQQFHFDPFLKIQRGKIDSLVKISSKKVTSINWDSIASEFANEMDSAIRVIKRKKEI
jgi:hypothetical protein